MTTWVLLAYGFVTLTPRACVLAESVGRRVARWRRSLRAGALSTVRGRLHAIRSVRSPMENVECCVAVTHFGGRDRWGVPHRVVLVTAQDFLLEADEGLHEVLASGLLLRGPWLSLDEPVTIALPPAAERAIAASPLASARALRWNEQIFLEDDLVELIGVRRVEQAAGDLPAGGSCDRPALPTLRAADGILELSEVSDSPWVRPWRS